MKQIRLFAFLAIIAALLMGAAGNANAQSAATAAATMAATNSAAATMAATMAGTMSGTKAAADTAGWPDTFIYGVFDSGDVGKALTTAEPLRAYLEKTLKAIKPSIRVVVYTGTSYTAVIAAMKAGRIDAFEVGPFAYILAAQEANAEALGLHAPDAGGATAFDANAKTFYLSTIITKKGNGANIKTLADLKGHTFSFVDPASTSGHLMPASIIKAAGIDPDKDMKTIYAGSHPTSVLSVATGKVDAGATFISNLFTQAKDGKIDLCYFADNDIYKQRTEKEFADLYASCKDGQIVPIAFSAPIPGTPFAINRALPQSFRTAVINALLSTQKDAEWIKANGFWYVSGADLKMDALDSYYNSLREVAKILGLDLKSIVK